MSLKVANNQSKNQEIIIQLRSRLRQYVAGKVRHIQDADDVVQESLARVCHYTDLTQLNSPMAYAIQVAKSVLAENYKKVAQFDFVEDSVEKIEQVACISSDENNLINEEKLALIQATLTNMPELRRKVFVRRKIDRYSREEIAQEFNMTIAAVKKHINRATVDLTVAMNKHGLSGEES